MKSFFILSDVHSFFDLMMDALLEEGFDIDNPDHIIISLGDIFDRGDQSKEMLDFFHTMMLVDRVILVKGNHEDLFVAMCEYGVTDADISNKTFKTLVDLQLEPIEIEPFKEKHKDTLEKLIKGLDTRIFELFNNSIDFYETKNYIFVHGFIPCEKTFPPENLYREFYVPIEGWRDLPSGGEEWQNARWINGMKAFSDGVVELPKTIVCGHWNAGYGWIRSEHPELDPSADLRAYEFANKNYSLPFMKEKGLIAMDACTAYFKRCNCLRIEEDEI